MIANVGRWPLLLAMSLLPNQSVASGKDVIHDEVRIPLVTR